MSVYPITGDGNTGHFISMLSARLVYCKRTHFPSVT